MTRIADSSASQALLQDFISLQRSMLDSQRQISTGKISQDFKGISSQIDLLMTTKSAFARSERFESIAQELGVRLDMQELHLSTVAEAAKDLRVNLTESLANDSGLVLREDLDSFVRVVSAALNTTFDGKYIFGGTRTDTPPVNIGNINQLVAAPTVASVFDNNQIKNSVRIDESQTIEFGFLASDIATDLFTSVRALDALGPFTEHLTAAQEAGIQAEMANIIAAAEAMNSTVSQNGVFQSETADAVRRHSDQGDFLLTVVSDIEDADPAEAISRLNQDQATAQATARILADMTRLSLLNFI